MDILKPSQVESLKKKEKITYWIFFLILYQLKFAYRIKKGT